MLKIFYFNLNIDEKLKKNKKSETNIFSAPRWLKILKIRLNILLNIALKFWKILKKIE